METPATPPVSDPWTVPLRPWTVYIDDNFHYMDEEARITRGYYPTLDEAVAVCMEITRQSVQEHAGGGMEGYTMFGDDPWVSPRPTPEELTGLLTRNPGWPAEAFERGYFSARLYADVLFRGLRGGAPSVIDSP